jgi:poly(A) polymerase
MRRAINSIGVIITERIKAALEGTGKPFQGLLQVAADREIYLVGGTIRDLIMGRQPVDFDFAVSGSGIELARKLAKKIRGSFVLLSEPDDQARVVYKVRGEQQRTVTLDFNGFGEGAILEDLKRRDFTMNAISLQIAACRLQTAESRDQLHPHPSPLPVKGEGEEGRTQNAECRMQNAERSELLDPFGGQQAIRDMRIVPVSGQALKSDPLRLLRAMRFALELGFEMDEEVLRQAREISFEAVAAERIGYELLRMLDCDGSYKYMGVLCELGFLNQMFPEAVPLFDDKPLMGHSMRTFKKLEQLIHRKSYFSAYEPEMTAYFGTNPHQRALLKLAGLFHDTGKPETEFINEKNEVHFYGHDFLGAKYIGAIGRDRLRLSRDDTKILKILVEFHMRLHLLATGPELTDRAIRRFFRDLGDQYFGLMMLTFADGFATAGVTRHLEEKFARMIALKHEYDSIVKIDRFVTGDDLIALGMKPGPEFKTILTEMQELQIEGKFVSKEAAVDYVKTQYTGAISNVKCQMSNQ